MGRESELQCDKVRITVWNPMDNLDLVFSQLEDLSVEQLAQLNRLLEAARTNMPPMSQTDTQRFRRSKLIAQTVVQLRAGMTDEELDELIQSLGAPA